MNGLNPPRGSVSLLEYYTAFKSVLGGIVMVLAALPFIAILLPQPIATYAFPPLGDSETISRVGTVGSVALATFVVYFLRSRRASLCVLTASLLAIGTFALYLVFFSTFVRKIDIPSEKTAVFVSVGFERTEFAVKTFDDASDWEMLRHRGLTEEAVRQLWTINSILIARLALWLSFSASVVFTAAALGFGIASQHERNSTAVQASA